MRTKKRRGMVPKKTGIGEWRENGRKRRDGERGKTGRQRRWVRREWAVGVPTAS